MANISWTSSSINSFFNTSLNTGNSAFGGLYGSLNDATMIKSGAYKKLMKSYVNELKASDKASKDDKTSSSDTKKHANAYTYDKNGKKTDAAIKNTVLDKLLAHEPYVSNSKNPYLNELFAKQEKENQKVTATADGTVVDKTADSDKASDKNVTDTTASTANASEAAAGAIVDEFA